MKPNSINWAHLVNAKYIDRVLTTIAYRNGTLSLMRDTIGTVSYEYWKPARQLIETNGTEELYLLLFDWITSTHNTNRGYVSDMVAMLLAYPNQSYLLDLPLDQVEVLGALGNAAAKFVIPYLMYVNYVKTDNQDTGTDHETESTIMGTAG